MTCFSKEGRPGLTAFGVDVAHTLPLQIEGAVFGEIVAG